LRALDGDLRLLLATMGPVVAIILVIIVNYQQLIGRFPCGGGASAAAGEAFGQAWSFVPIGALIGDFVLMIAISAAAGARTDDHAGAIAFDEAQLGRSPVHDQWHGAVRGEPRDAQETGATVSPSTRRPAGRVRVGRVR
jgi:hypothetical protein